MLTTMVTMTLTVILSAVSMVKVSTLPVLFNTINKILSNINLLVMVCSKFLCIKASNLLQTSVLNT